MLTLNVHRLEGQIRIPNKVVAVVGDVFRILKSIIAHSLSLQYENSSLSCKLSSERVGSKFEL